MSAVDCTPAGRCDPDRNVTRTLLRSMAIGAILLCGCRDTPPPAAAPAAFTPLLDTRQLMEWVIDPAADVIWDSVKSISTEAGTKEIRPETDEQWAAVRNAGATLAESGNLLLLKERARDGKEWVDSARLLVTNADKAIKAAQAKDAEALFTAGGDLYVACRTCHQQFAPHLNASDAPLRLASARSR